MLPNIPTSITLCEPEAKALYAWLALLIQELGATPPDVFDWCERDNINDPLTSALFKLYRAAGERIPVPRTKAEWEIELKTEAEALAKKRSDGCTGLPTQSS